MAAINGTPYPGPYNVDLSNVKDSLIDLPPGARRGLRTEQEGISPVVAELLASTPEQRQAADIPAHVYQRFVERTKLMGTLREHEVVLAKALEVVTETRAKTENDREDDLGILAQAAKATADRQRNPALAAPFEKTIKYNGQIAEKAVATRKKNAEAKNAAAKQGAQGESHAQPAENQAQPA